MNQAPNLPPPRWGPLTPQRWPQDENRVPNSTGLPMPPVGPGNRLRSRRESFTYSTSYNWTGATTAPGAVFQAYIPTDPDGDFWCDQIAITAWQTVLRLNARPPPQTIAISDARSGRALTYPTQVPMNWFTTLQLYSDDPGFDPSSSPFPDGYRSTTTLPQPFCFTRAGGIQLNMTALTPSSLARDYVIDIGLSGWKEYEAASA